jgi:hypothetical protein
LFSQFKGDRAKDLQMILKLFLLYFEGQFEALAQFALLQFKELFKNLKWVVDSVGVLNLSVLKLFCS